jgi:hypothetical protein
MEREEKTRSGAGSRTRRALESALLEVFQRQQQEEEEQGGGNARDNSGSKRKTKTKHAGAGGLDKRQLVELLNARHTYDDGDDAGEPRGARVDERAVGAALKGMVSRGVLRVHQGRWYLAAPPPTPAAAAATLGSAPLPDDADGEADDEPAATSTAASNERKKTKKVGGPDDTRVHACT